MRWRYAGYCVRVFDGVTTRSVYVQAEGGPVREVVADAKGTGKADSAKRFRGAVDAMTSPEANGWRPAATCPDWVAEAVGVATGDG